MRQANLPRVTAIKFESQATMQVPGQGPTAKAPASNDEVYLLDEPPLKMAVSILANVVGGAVLLVTLFNLPIVLAAIWGL